MKYDCFGCKYAPYNRQNTLCTKCGKYVLSEDGEGTVYVYTNWIPKEEIECEAEKNLNDWMKYYEKIEKATDEVGITLEQGIKFLEVLYRNDHNN